MKRVVGGSVGAALDEAGTARQLREQIGQRGDVSGAVVFEAELGSSMSEIHSVRSFPKSLALVRLDSQREESENSAAVVVHHDERHGFTPEERKGIEIVKKCQVSEEGGDRFSGT
jgi:hypothetical protein